MKQLAAQALAVWLERNQPEVFREVMQQAARTGAELAGITDFLKSIGSGIASATKQVGSFLASKEGQATLATVGATVLQSQAQKNALQVQLAQAQVGQPPAPIETRFDPVTASYVPIYTAAGAQQPLTPGLAQQLLRETDWKRLAPWLIGGGLLAGPLLLWALTRRGR